MIYITSLGYPPLLSLCSILSSRTVEVETTSRVVLVLQLQKLGASPALVAVHLLLGLITIGIVEVNVLLAAAAASVQDVAKLVAKGLGLGIKSGIARSVLHKRSSEEVVLAESIGGGGGIDSLDTLHGVTLEHEEGVGEGGRGVGALLEGLVDLGHGGGVVLGEVQREAGVGSTGLLARGSIEGDADPAGDILVGTSVVGDRDGTESNEGGGVGSVDSSDTLLDDVKLNNGAGGVNGGNVHPVRPVDDVNRLGAVLEEVVVGGLVESLDLVTSVHQGGDGPVGVDNGEDLDGDRSDDTKVVASALEGPPQVRVGVDGAELAIGSDDLGRDKLISNEAVVALQPSVAAAESGTHVADALAGTGHGLLAGSPKVVDEDLGVGATEDSSSLPITRDADT